ncbi:DNA (cytosine-5)-methyltransferase 1 [Pilibacter termitis]|uniref:Cytosine-specific methyltransferase n=1 Tax=Pilibacter termitis TaxID=263852 RepID=A0A1T4PTY0_9ENTE|nr:DNA cytosine methyltransferase [Pilibacter termitis]SJZ94378.1 DNA (cytosine-5)-methyltransferase 1 [Pilibacter termitis]
MRGGNRKGAGRKNVPDSQKKHPRNIYLTDDIYQEIMSTEVNDCNNFSQKCVELIQIGLYKLREGMQMSKIDKSKSIYMNDQIVECTTQKNNQLTFIDLFAGIGGIRKGFEDSNTTCVFSSEWDKYAAKTYEANYGEIPYGDITKINSKDIPNHDVLLAGFPCQPFSNIGKREGFSHETQGTLFFDVLRILKEKQPKMFLLENVKGLLTNDNGNTFNVIMEKLSGELGYNTFHKVLDAQNFGLPQRRERVVIVGFRPDLCITDFEFPNGNSNVKVPISSILEKNPKGYTISKHLQNSYLFKKDDGKPQLVDFDSDIQVNTLVASYHKIQRLTGTFVKDGDTGVRLFSELEAKRLMGFPDDFVVPVSRTQMYRQFGNSVAVPMMRAVADTMKETLIKAENKMKPITDLTYV